MISVFINGNFAESKRIRFPDGAVEYILQSDLPEKLWSLHYSVSPQIGANEMITELAMMDSIFSGAKPAKKSLLLPYLPYARADRKFNHNGSSGLASFLWLLESFEFDEVMVSDPHNHSVLPDNFTISDQKNCLLSVLPKINMHQYDAVVSPDKGAVNKARSIANHFELPTVVCSKVRDEITGALSSPEIVHGDASGKRVIIVDDICDGGYTFIQLADLLYAGGAIQIDLYVTHLIASKGLSVFNGKINSIYFYQIVGNYVTKETVFNFNKGAL